MLFKFIAACKYKCNVEMGKDNLLDIPDNLDNYNKLVE